MRDTFFVGMASANMTVSDIAEIIERWAPGQIAWEKDNLGLQVGEFGARVRGILVSLDITRQIIAEAERKRCNLIVSHHPLLFRPLRNINIKTEQGRCLQLLLRRGMNVYAAHTNLDFTRGGTSFALASTLGLERLEFLRKSYPIAKKIVTYVPPK